MPEKVLRVEDYLHKAKVKEAIQGYCPSEDEMDKEIELVFLKNRLKRLTPEEIYNLLKDALEWPEIMELQEWLENYRWNNSEDIG